MIYTVLVLSIIIMVIYIVGLHQTIRLYKDRCEFYKYTNKH